VAREPRVGHQVLLYLVSAQIAKNDKTTLGSDDALVIFSLTNHVDPYFLA